MGKTKVYGHYLGLKLKKEGAYGLECTTSKPEEAREGGLALHKPKVAQNPRSAQIFLHESLSFGLMLRIACEEAPVCAYRQMLAQLSHLFPDWGVETCL